MSSIILLAEIFGLLREKKVRMVMRLFLDGYRYRAVSVCCALLHSYTAALFVGLDEGRTKERWLHETKCSPTFRSVLLPA
jgi:hypothetical protein